jgi:prepilin-type N-terminal cleavage/methylation domain-containing protein
MNRVRQIGFTLIEISIVLLIVSIILGYTVAMVPVQQELKQYREAEAEMTRIIDSLYAFAQVNGYLPCPAWTTDINDPTPAGTSNGFECREGGDASACDGGNPQTDKCEHYFGYLPGKTLGFEGRYSSVNKLLLDPWGMPYRYQVTNVDGDDTDDDGASGPGTEGRPDFVIQGAMKAATSSTLGNPFNVGLLNPDLVICNADPSPTEAGTNNICVNAAQAIFGAYVGSPCTDPAVDCSPAVVLSTGKDKGSPSATNWVQLENLDNHPDNDRVFVKASRVEQGTQDSDGNALEYDDIVKWVSPNILYSKMIQAGQLP